MVVCLHKLNSFACSVLLTISCLLHHNQLSSSYPIINHQSFAKSRVQKDTHDYDLDNHSKLDGCDFFQGSWVYDENYYPLYNTSTCTFIDNYFDCQGNGRPDNLYLKYKWRPASCDLPRFDGKKLLKMMKGKKVLFVGDSLSLNQWESLVCMLHVAVPHSTYTLQRMGYFSTFSIPEYEVSISLSRDAFLVDIVKTKMGRVLKLDSIENGNAWIGYDMLIFNTWHWWLHKGSKQPWDFMEGWGHVEKDMDRLVAFKGGLTTWSQWVDSNVNPNVTKVFFQGISPTHYKGTEWNEPKSSTCEGQSTPINDSTYHLGLLPKATTVVKEVLGNMSSNIVVLLDITGLSLLRKDGHTSIYGKLGGSKGNDCSHWCLSGVPDTWNQILYAILVRDKFARK